MKHRFIYLLLAVQALISLQVSSQVSTPLDTIIIVGQRIAVPEQLATKHVTIIDAEQIAAMPVQSMDELLRALPGVNVNSRGPFGVQADIGMRGSTFSQVMVLVDGMRFNDPLTAHFNHGLPIPLAEIERIEILRGPASAAYGSDAVGGIIHIITKGFAGGAPGFDFQSDMMVGSFGSTAVDAGLSYRDDNVRFGIGFKSNAGLGEELLNPNRVNESATDSVYSNDFDIKSVTMNFGYQLSKRLSIDTRVAHDERDFSARYFYTGIASDESRETTGADWAQARLQYQADKSNTDATVAYRDGSDAFVFRPSFTPNLHSTQRLDVGLNHQHHISDRLQLAAGILLHERWIDSNNRGDHSDKSQGAYGILSYQFSEFLRIEAGARLEEDDNFGTAFNPQLGLNFHKGAFTFRAEAGTAVRGADYTERYNNDLLPAQFLVGRSLGNPDLRAEESVSTSIGFSYDHKRHHFSADGFTRESTNLIDYSPAFGFDIDNASNVLSDSLYLYAQNISEVSTMGVELSYRNDLLREVDHALSIGASYTYLEAKTPEGTPPSKYLSNHPRHDLNGLLQWRYGRLSTTVVADYTYRQQESDLSFDAEIPRVYTLLHLNAQLRVSDEISAMVKVHNLLDEQYQEILGAQMPGRWVMVGFRLQLSE